MKAHEILKLRAEIKYGLRDANGKLTSKGKALRAKALKEKKEQEKEVNGD